MACCARPSIRPAPLGGIGNADVVGDREIRQQRQFLEYANDARAIRRRRVDEGDGLAFEFDDAGIRLDDAGDDLDKCGFAGAVLAEDGVYAAGVALKTDVFKRPDAAVVL